MIFFRRKNKPSADFSNIRTDIHSHLLPGIDDGVPSVEVSLRIIRGMVSLGYRKLVTTPHIMWDMYKNTPAMIQARLDEVQLAIQKEGIDIELSAAAEYFIDDHFEELLREKKPLLAIKDNLVLVEFSMVSQPFDLKEVLFEMQMQGYQPIIAHPERYVYLDQNKTFYDELKDSGCFFQCNLLSLSGYYGKTVQELAKYLTRARYYDYVGSDIHSLRHMESLRSSSLRSNLDKLLETCNIRNHLL